MELITLNNDNALLNSFTSAQLVEIEQKIKSLENERDEIKNALKSEMERLNIIGVKDEINGVTVSYVAESDTESFDKKKFRSEHPDLYDEYITFKKRASYITVKVK